MVCRNRKASDKRKNKTSMWVRLVNKKYPLRYLVFEGFLAVLVILAIIFLIFWI